MGDNDLFNPFICVANDNALLKENEMPEKSSLKLKHYSSERFDVEYQEACNNVRHYEQLRNSIMKFWAQLNGFLFAAIGLAFGQLKNYPEYSVFFMIATAIFVILITFFVLMMEEREMDYFAVLCQRCRILESREGFSGQFWRTYVELVLPTKKISRRITMRMTYVFGAFFWGIVLIYIVRNL